MLVNIHFYSEMALRFSSLGMQLLDFAPPSHSHFLEYTPWVNATSVTYGLVPGRRKKPVYT